MLIAKKPCSFGGQQFFIGDEIPASYVLDPKTQEAMGVIVIVGGDAESGSGTDVCGTQPIVISDPTLTICVNVDGSDMELEPTDRGLQDIFNVLIGHANEAEAIINGMDDEDALILLHMSDSRKTVKAAAEARAKELANPEDSEPEEAGEQ